jgi:hypothetical protein
MRISCFSALTCLVLLTMSCNSIDLQVDGVFAEAFRRNRDDPFPRAQRIIVRLNYDACDTLGFGNFHSFDEISFYRELKSGDTVDFNIDYWSYRCESLRFRVYHDGKWHRKTLRMSSYNSSCEGFYNYRYIVK